VHCSRALAMEPVQDAEITMTTQAADDGSGAMEESPAKRQARELSTPVPPTAAERLRDKHAPHGRCPFDHSDDVFAAMRRKEVAHFNQRSTYLQYRGVIVEWMCEVAEEVRESVLSCPRSFGPLRPTRLAAVPACPTPLVHPR